MKLPLLIICSFAILTARGQTYVASTPCSGPSKPVPEMKNSTGCELIKWNLHFSKNNYTLDMIYGLPEQGTRNFIGGGTKLHREGKWVLVAQIIKLDPDKPAETIAFRRLSESLLHLLDDGGRLMIGNGAWSYTLNKAKP